MPARILLIAVLCLAAWTPFARANPPARRPPPPRNLELGQKEVTLVVVSRDTNQRAELQVPDSLLGSVAAKGAGLHMPNLVVGVALTLAFVTGGLWLVRNGRTGRAVTMLLLSLVIVSGCGPQGNSTVNPTNDGKDPNRPKAFVVDLPADVTLSGELDLNIHESEKQEVTLVVPPSWVEKSK